MTDAWAPRRVRLKRRVHPGDTTIQVYESTTSGFLARLGTELVTVSGAGDTWGISPAASQNHHADGYLTEVTTRIIVNGVEHTGVAQHLKHKEESPKGELEATWDIYTRSPSTYTPNLDGSPQLFTLQSNESGSWVPFFSGYMGRVGDGQQKNGFHELNLTGRGAFVTASWQPITNSQVWTADTAEHTVVQDVLGLYAPYITTTAEHILDGGLNIGEQLEGIGHNLRYFLDWVVGRGDADGQPLDWFVRTDPDGAIKLWLILRSREPTVEIPISSIRAPAKFVKDYEYVKNYVMVKWQGGYVDAVPIGGTTGALRGLFFDYSSRIDNEPLARQVADMILANSSVVQALTDGDIEIDYPNQVLVSGSPFPLHRVRAGWNVVITGWAGGFSLGTPKQIKQLEADHVQHRLSLGCGSLIEDDLNIGAQFFDKQTKILGSPVSGIVPLNIAAPEGMPNDVSSAAVASGASGILGYGSTGNDTDITQSTYNIDGGKDADGNPVPIVAGRKFPEDGIEIGGRLMGFKVRGNDGMDVPGPGTISIKVWLGHEGDLPAPGTGITTIGLSGEAEHRWNLSEPPATTNVIQDLLPGDYLVYEVLADSDVLNNVAITRLIQRTGGSSRGIAGGSASILSQAASRDSATGIVTFSVTTDRPAYLQIEFGKTASYGSFSRKTEFVNKVSQVGEILQTPFHWRAIVTDNDGHKTLGSDQIG